MENHSDVTSFASFLEAVKSGNIGFIREGLDKWPAFVTQRETTGDGWAAIHHAVANGAIESATLLLDAGCDANLPSGSFVKDGEDDRHGYFEPGVTPLAVATWKDQFAMVKLLLAHGADPTGSDRFSYTAVHIAAAHNHISILNLLLAHGADMNLSSDRRFFDEELDWHFALTPLHATAQTDAVESACCLLAHGAWLDACSFDKRTPLFYAAARGSSGVARVLLKAGADPNAREDRPSYGSCLDFTPLHYAAGNGHAETVKVLLEFGADQAALECNRKWTAREHAHTAGHQSVIAVLDAGVELPGLLTEALLDFEAPRSPSIKYRLSEFEIVRQLAKHKAKHITRRIISALQRRTDCNLSGDDSMLANTWDEICAQVQGEQSYAWDVYVETMKAILAGEVELLAPYEREALWLQTNQGSEWDSEDEKDREPYPIYNGDIVEYLLSDHVLTAADGWSNPRIRAYLDWSSMRD